VQFIDGDCELVSGWLTIAPSFLLSIQTSAQFAVVCESETLNFPLYNWLCDQEWNTPTGEIEVAAALPCSALRHSNKSTGFGRILLLVKIPNSIFGCENPHENLAALKWDGDTRCRMSRFNHWWRRSARAGYAYAQVSRLHASSPVGYGDGKKCEQYLGSAFATANIVRIAFE